MNGEDTNLAIFQRLGDIQKDLGSISTGLENLRTEILGDGGRIPKIESKIETAETRTWIHSSVILPLNLGIHVLANKLGWRI